MKLKLLIIFFIITMFFESHCQKNNMDSISSKINIEQYQGNKIKKSEKELKKLLTPEQYFITQKKGTEKPFTGEFDNFHEKGEYHCVVCDLLLFESNSKFKSGCGWPSFYDLAKEKNINYNTDKSHNMTRVEVTCSRCDAHLGHIFNDGPPPTYLRYCINSASLKFKKE